jgi:nucleotide-binding universal stress UspA family protein
VDLIVVGLDKSESARRAAAEAVHLATAIGAAVHFVMAVKKGRTVEVVGATNDRWTVDNIEVAKAQLDDIAAEVGQGVRFSTAVVEGGPADVLVDEADRLDADLILVGSRRMHGVGRLLGAVANDVAHHAPCSVYIAKTV